MKDVERLRAAAPGDLAAVLGRGVPADLAGILAGSHRFADRLVEAAAGRIEDPDSLDPRQAAVLALAPAAVRGLVRRAGAVWHARALARVVDGAALRDLAAALGPGTYAVALEERGLAPPAEANPAFTGDLIEAVSADGAACWGAWVARQPRPVAVRLALLGGGAPPGAAHAAFGPPIVDRLLDLPPDPTSGRP